MTSKQDATLCIIPGWGGSKQTWSPFIKQSEKQFKHVLCIELPCFGDEPCPKSVWGVDEYALFVKKKLEGWQEKHDEKLILLGHSFGGQVATLLAAKYPYLIDSLVLVGAAVVRRRKLVKRGLFFLLAKTGTILLCIPGLSKLQPLARRVLHKVADSPDYGKTEGMRRKIYQKIIRQDLRHLLPAISVPTTVLWGRRDKHTRLTDGQTIAKLIPGATMITYSDGRHGLHHTHVTNMLEELSHI